MWRVATNSETRENSEQKLANEATFEVINPEAVHFRLNGSCSYRKQQQQRQQQRDLNKNSNIVTLVRRKLYNKIHKRVEYSQKKGSKCWPERLLLRYSVTLLAQQALQGEHSLTSAPSKVPLYKSTYIILVFVPHSYEKPLAVKWISQFMSFDVHFFLFYIFQLCAAIVLWRCLVADSYLHVVVVVAVVVVNNTIAAAQLQARWQLWQAS